MITVTISDTKSYTIDSDRVDELVTWLTDNSSPLESQEQTSESDKTLLNEDATAVEEFNPYPKGTPQHYLHNIQQANDRN